MYQRLLLCCLIHSLISVSLSYVPVKDGRHSIESTEASVSKLEHHEEQGNFNLTPTAVHTKYESSVGRQNNKDLNQKEIEHEIKQIFKELKEDSHGDESILIKTDPILEQKTHAKDEHNLHGEDHHKHSDHSLFVSSRRNPSLYHSEEHIDDRDKVDFNVFRIKSHQSEEFDGIGDVHEKHDHKTSLHDNDEHGVDFNIFKRSHIHEAHDDISKKHLHHEEVNAHKHHDVSCKDTKVIEHSGCANKDYHAPLPHVNHHGHVGVSGLEKHDVGSTINKEKCHDEKKIHHFDEHLDKASEVHHHASGKSEHKHDAKPLECEPKKPEHSLHHVPHHDHHFKPHTPVKDHHRDHDFEDSHEFVFSSGEYHHKYPSHVHPHHHDYDYHHHHHHHHPHHHHDSHHYGHHYHH